MLCQEQPQFSLMNLIILKGLYKAPLVQTIDRHDSFAIK